MWVPLNKVNYCLVYLIGTYVIEFFVTLANRKQMAKNYFKESIIILTAYIYKKSLMIHIRISR